MCRSMHGFTAVADNTTSLPGCDAAHATAKPFEIIIGNHSTVYFTRGLPLQRCTSPSASRALFE